jgi:hypothetical protein
VEIKEKLQYIQGSFGKLDFLGEYTNFSTMEEATSKINKLKTEIEILEGESDLKYFNIDLGNTLISKEIFDLIRRELNTMKEKSSIVANDIKIEPKIFLELIKTKYDMLTSVIEKIQKNTKIQIDKKNMLTEIKYLKNMNYTDDDFTFVGRDSTLATDSFIDLEQSEIRKISTQLSYITDAIRFISQENNLYQKIIELYQSISTESELSDITIEDFATNGRIYIRFKTPIDNEKKILIDFFENNIKKLIPENAKRRSIGIELFKNVDDYIYKYSYTTGDNPIQKLKKDLEDKKTEYAGKGISVQTNDRIVKNIGKLEELMKKHKKNIEYVNILDRFSVSGLYDALIRINDPNIPVIQTIEYLNKKTDELTKQIELLQEKSDMIDAATQKISGENTKIQKIIKDMKRGIYLLNINLNDTIKEAKKIQEKLKIDLVDLLPQIEISEETAKSAEKWYASGGDLEYDKVKIEQIINITKETHDEIYNAIIKLSIKMNECKLRLMEYANSTLELLSENQYAIYHMFYVITIMYEIIDGKYKPLAIISKSSFDRRSKNINTINKKYLMFTLNRIKSIIPILEELFSKQPTNILNIDENKRSFLDILTFVHLCDISIV